MPSNVSSWSRRSLLASLPLATAAWSAAPDFTPSKTQTRNRAALAKHRNLFNGDSCVYFYNPELWQPEGGPFSAKAIHRYVDLLADSGVDTFLINPNAQVAWYPSKKLQTVLDGYKRGDREFFRGHAIASNTPPEKMDEVIDRSMKFFNQYQDLIDAGVDWLAETSKACRRRKISPWVSVRMNDMHGYANPKGSHFNADIFKDERMRLSGRAFDPKEGVRQYWRGLNYEHREVRDFMMSHIREHLEVYDFDGMELDWLRNPICCEPVATRKQWDLMTEWTAEVRKHTEARASRTGRPCPLGLRIPPNLGYLKDIGLDVPRLIREGLIDFIGFSNFWQTSWDLPYDELRRLVGDDVRIYGVVEDAPNWIFGDVPNLPGTNTPIPKSQSGLGVRYMSASAPMQWANAAGKLAMGVHGIEQFNFFCTDQPRVPGLRADYAALRSAADLKSLRGKPKHYCLQSPPSGPGSCCANQSLIELPEPIPVTLDPGGRREFRISMCSEPADTKLTVQVVLPRSAVEPHFGVSVNGCWPSYTKVATRDFLFPIGLYTKHIPESQAYNFEFSSKEILEGWNRIVVMNPTRKPDATIRILSLELGVKPA